MRQKRPATRGNKVRLADRCRVDRIVKGEYSKPSIPIVHWAIRKAKKTASAQWKAGTRLRVEADLYDAHPELATITTFEGPADIDLVPHWALKAEWLGDAGAPPRTKGQAPRKAASP
jgi:hypothetical protein